MGKTVCRRKPTEAERRAWPRLSEIPERRHRDFCQNCSTSDNLTAWQEHDHNDQPERILVILCRSCANLMVPPHPRLYRELEENEPWPGFMAICRECPFRRGLKCTHPNRRNGTLRITQQSPIHVTMRPRGLSRWIWSHPATDCEGLH